MTIAVGISIGIQRKIDMKLPISFEGLYYRGSDKSVCAFCGERLSREWVIYENQSGARVTLCERDYKKWENKRTAALMQVSDEFRLEFQAK